MMVAPGARDNRREKAKAAAALKAARKERAGLSRTLKLRVYPRTEQVNQINRTIGTVRFVWNTIWLPMLEAAEKTRREYAEQNGGSQDAWKVAWKAHPDPKEQDYNRARIAAMNENGGRSWIKEAELTPLTRAVIAFADAVKSSRGQTRSGQQRKSKLGRVQPRRRADDSRAGLEWQLQGKGPLGGRPLAQVVDPESRIVNVPGIGPMPFKDKARLLRRYFEAGVEACELTVKRAGLHFYACIAVRGLQPAEAHAHIGAAIGIEMGVVAPLTTSDGELVTHHQGHEIKTYLAKLEHRKMKAKRSLLRKLHEAARQAGAITETGTFKKGVPIPTTNRMRRMRKRINKIDQQIVGYRANWQRNTALKIAQASEIIVIEALTTRDMTKSVPVKMQKPGRNVRSKAGLSSAILARGFGSMRSRLKSKAEELCGRVLEIEPAYSSRTCPKCGCEDRENRKTQADFACVACGYREHADIVGALNILHRGMSPGAPPGAGRGGRATGSVPSGADAERADEPSSKSLRVPPVSDTGLRGTRSARPHFSRNESDQIDPVSRAHPPPVNDTPDEGSCSDG